MLLGVVVVGVQRSTDSALVEAHRLEEEVAHRLEEEEVAHRLEEEVVHNRNHLRSLRRSRAHHSYGRP